MDASRRKASYQSLSRAWAIACLVLAAGGVAHAQPIERLPDIYVTASRLGTGIVGTSTSVITGEEIERSAGYTLQDLLAQQPGIQLQNLHGGVGGASSTVDMRGFGAFAVSNTLVLVNGRRLNDVDMAGVDFLAIPRTSIDRIEITRGNSGAVLYGDGAVGGVINIITKTNVGLPPSARISGAFGSFRQREGGLSANTSSGPFTASAYGNAIDSDGYRVNNELRERNAVGDFRYAGELGSVYFNISGDDQHLGLPGARRVTLATSQVATDPRGATTPFDYADKQGLNATGGVSRMLAPGTELIVDGGVRHKAQQAAAMLAFLENYIDTTLTTLSLTPRIISSQTVLGLPAKAVAGVDVYHSNYDSARSLRKGDPPHHRYAIDQLVVAGYLQPTIAVRPDTDVSAGVRVQRADVSARDRFDPTAPANFPPPEGIPLDKTETNRALHVGIEHRPNDHLAIFARMARSFRFPNVDERIGLALFGTPTTFDLRTQTSRDYEGGVRARWGAFSGQASIYDMRLENEIHFDPINFVNFNLDPTRRYGYESAATYQVNAALRLKAGLAYTRSVFRAGAFAGNDVPLVSRWTENAGVSWDIWGRRLVFDGVVRYVGARRMDNDQANFQPLIPPTTLVDLKIGGEIDRFYWSVAVFNVFDVHYFDYAVASSFTFGTYNAYPLPGRTFLARGAVTY